MEIKDRDDRGRGPDEAADVSKEGALGVGLIGGDHGAVQEQDHRR